MSVISINHGKKHKTAIIFPCSNCGLHNFISFQRIKINNHNCVQKAKCQICKFEWIEFLHGSDDHSFSNDNDNVKILAMIAFTLYILYLRYAGIEKLVDDDLNKLFVRLSRVVPARDEQAVSIPELKIVIGKALRVLIAKLDTKTQADEKILY